jgi:hypothetical protein
VKITYNGGAPVDIAAHDNVQPGQTVEVSDAVGAALLLAGSQVADDGTITPPAAPLWTAATTAAKAAKEA